MPLPFKFEMGAELKDVVTGFQGVVTARVEWLTGCNQYRLQPQGLTADGKIKEADQFDENRVEQVSDGITLPGTNANNPDKSIKDVKTGTGGPQPNVRQSH
jgi:hypothetical protein